MGQLGNMGEVSWDLPPSTVVLDFLSPVTYRFVGLCLRLVLATQGHPQMSKGWRSASFMTVLVQYFLLPCSFHDYSGNA